MLQEFKNVTIDCTNTNSGALVSSYTYHDISKELAKIFAEMQLMEDAEKKGIPVAEQVNLVYKHTFTAIAMK